MPDIERGRLCSIGMDGSDSIPYIIKKDCTLFGRGDSCDIRIYVDGVAPEHCLITFDEDGKGFLEPVNKCGLTFLNGEVIEKEMILKHNDVITVVKRSFRFLYPSSSRYFVRASFMSASHSEENTVTDHSDFDPEIALKKSKEFLEKRVTFGPSLTPEEFDRNLPPASPLRRGSLPSKKLKKKKPGIHSDIAKVHVVRNLFKNIRTTDNSETEAAYKHKLSNSTVVLQKLRSKYECSESGQKFESRPLFSDILKKRIANPNKTMVVHKRLQKFSARRLPKKTLKFQNTKRSIFKSPRARVHPQILAVGSTGHANSPETIVIYKKKYSSVSADRSSSRLSKMQQKESSKPSTPNSASNVVDARTEKYSENVEHSITDHTSYCCHEEYPNFENNVQMNCSERYNSQMTTACSTLSLNQKHKRLSKEDDVHAKKTDAAAKETASLLAGTINDVPRLDEHSIDKSLKDISNAVQELSSHAGVPLCMNNAFSSPDMCMDVVKKLALTISMVNAFHIYNKIINDVSSFPLCFPSTSFQTADSMKCIQKSKAHQSEEKMDFQQFSWFQDIMQYFFANSLNGNACDAREPCMLSSYENALNSEVSSSSCHKKMRKSRSAAKKSSVMASASGYKKRTSKNQIVCYDTSLMNSNGVETNKVKEADAIHSKECNTYKAKSSTSVENVRHPSTTDEDNMFLPDTCLNHSPSYKKDFSSCHQSLCSHVLDSEEVSQKTLNSRKENIFNDNCEKLIKNVRKSFGGFTRKHKFMQLKRKSLSLSYLKRGKRLEKFIEKMSDNNSTVKALPVSLNQRSMRSKANAALKAKKKKASLILQKYGLVSLKENQGGKNKRKSSMHKQGSEKFDVTLRSTKRKRTESTLPKVKRMKITPRKSSEENAPAKVNENKKASRLSKPSSSKDGTPKSIRGLRKRKNKQSSSPDAKQMKTDQKAIRTVRIVGKEEEKKNNNKKRKSVLVDKSVKRASKVAKSSKGSTPKNVRERKKKRTSESSKESPNKKNLNTSRNKGENTDDITVTIRKQKSNNLKDKVVKPVQRKTRKALKKIEVKELSIEMLDETNKKNAKSSSVSFLSEETPMKSITQTPKEGEIVAKVQRRTRSALKRAENEELSTVKVPRRNTKKNKDEMVAVTQRKTRSALKRIEDEELSTVKVPRRKLKKKEDDVMAHVPKETETTLIGTKDKELSTGKMSRRNKKNNVKSSDVSFVTDGKPTKSITQTRKEGKKKLKDGKSISPKELPTQRLTRSRQSAKKRRA